MFSTKETDLFPLQFSWLKLNRSMWINNYFRISAPLSLIRGYCFFTNYVAVLIFSFELQKYGMKKKKNLLGQVLSLCTVNEGREIFSVCTFYFKFSPSNDLMFVMLIQKKVISVL